MQCALGIVHWALGIVHWALYFPSPTLPILSHSTPAMGLCYSSISLQVLIAGLDESGKSSLFHTLRSKNVRSSKSSSTAPLNTSTYKPTLSFQHATLRLGRRVIDVKDLSGSPLTRDLWKHYVTGDVAAVIFVVDSACKARIDEARQELHKLMQLPSMPRDIPLLVLANKIDLRGHLTYAELTEQLQLNALRSHMQSKLKLVSVLGGDGVEEVVEWLAHLSPSPTASVK